MHKIVLQEVRFAFNNFNFYLINNILKLILISFLSLLKLFNANLTSLNTILCI
jgi:hypothetical protein